MSDLLYRVCLVFGSCLSTMALGTELACNDANPFPPYSSARLFDEGDEIRVKVWADDGDGRGMTLRADFLASREAAVFGEYRGFQYVNHDGSKKFQLIVTDSQMSGYLEGVTAPGLECAGTP